MLSFSSLSCRFVCTNLEFVSWRRSIVLLRSLFYRLTVSSSSGCWEAYVRSWCVFASNSEVLFCCTVNLPWVVCISLSFSNLKYKLTKNINWFDTNNDYWAIICPMRWCSIDVFSRRSCFSSRNSSNRGCGFGNSRIWSRRVLSTDIRIRGISAIDKANAIRETVRALSAKFEVNFCLPRHAYLWALQ